MTSFCALLFDFDGVIAHTTPIVQQALWRFFREKEIMILEKDFQEDGYATKSLEQVCDTIAQKYNITLDVTDLRKHIWNTQTDLMNEGLIFDHSLLLLLELCQRKNIPVGVGSNSVWTRIEWILDKMNIRWYFDTIIWAHDVVHHKPDPEVWIQCAAHLHVAHEKCLVIDDGYPGLLGARSCHMSTIYYHRYGSLDQQCLAISDFHTNSFDDIIKLLPMSSSCK